MRPPPKASERWLGRAKHVYLRVLGEPAIVGRAITLGVDLEAAVPTNLEGGPSLTARSKTSTLLAQLLRKVNERDLILYSKDFEVPISTRVFELPPIPLTVAGELMLKVTLDGADIHQSPMLLHVAPAVADVRTTEIVVSGRDGSKMSLRAAEPGAFFVMLRDEHGNRTNHTADGDAPVRVQLTREEDGFTVVSSSSAGRSAADAKGADAGGSVSVGAVDADGTACVTLALKRTGSYAVAVWVDGCRLQQTAEVEVVAGASCTSEAQVGGEASVRAIAGELSRFVILTHDKHGNRRTKGGDEWICYVEPQVGDPRLRSSRATRQLRCDASHDSSRHSAVAVHRCRPGPELGSHDFD